MNVVYSVQARLGSTRLPGKVLYNLSDKKVLEWVIKRGKECSVVSSTHVTIGNKTENSAIIELCSRRDIEYSQGPEENLLERHEKVLHMTDCDILCRVTGDCPFVPPSEITRTVKTHLSNNARYTTNHTRQMPIGTSVDVINRDVLVELIEKGDTHPVKRLRQNPEKWNVAYTEDDKWTQFAEAHTAVDTPEDYWRLVDAVETVGTNPLAVTKWVYEQS